MPSPLETRRIQTALKSLGIYVGKVDGIAGSKTKAAIKGFQRINGLADDGIAGPITLAKLFPSLVPALIALPKAIATQKRTWPRQKDVPEFYGAKGANQIFITPPYPMRIAWNLSDKVRKISLHSEVAASAERALTVVRDTYSASDRVALGLDLFGGSLAVRKMRGGTAWSMHSWGIAIDFDPLRNQLTWGKDRARLAKADCVPFWEAWEAEGWISLGRARGFDFMHIQAARM